MTNHWTYVCNANPVELEDLVFRTNAGHVKQGLRCKHCRVNIHQSCGAKVLLDKVNFPWSLQSIKYRIKDIIDQFAIDKQSNSHVVFYSLGECLPAKEEKEAATARQVLRRQESVWGKWITKWQVSLAKKSILNCLLYPITLFLPVNGGGQGACPLTQWKTHGICP